MTKFRVVFLMAGLVLVGAACGGSTGNDSSNSVEDVDLCSGFGGFPTTEVMAHLSNGGLCKDDDGGNVFLVSASSDCEGSDRKVYWNNYGRGVEGGLWIAEPFAEGFTTDDVAAMCDDAGEAEAG